MSLIYIYNIIHISCVYIYMSLLSINMVSFPFLFYRFGQVAFLTFSPIIPASFTDVTIPVANTFGESGPPLDATKTYRFVASSDLRYQYSCCMLLHVAA